MTVVDIEGDIAYIVDEGIALIFMRSSLSMLSIWYLILSISFTKLVMQGIFRDLALQGKTV